MLKKEEVFILQNRCERGGIIKKKTFYPTIIIVCYGMNLYLYTYLPI